MTMTDALLILMTPVAALAMAYVFTRMDAREAARLRREKD
jgi:hypothetical protein